MSIINKLTYNEDHRQDLWVAYLSGITSTPESVHRILSHLEVKDLIENKFKKSIQDLVSYNIPIKFITHLTENEKIVVCLLVLGCDIGTISRYNGVSEVKINQMIGNLKISNVRNLLDGAQETLQ